MAANRRPHVGGTQLNRHRRRAPELAHFRVIQLLVSPTVFHVNIESVHGARDLAPEFCARLNASTS